MQYLLSEDEYENLAKKKIAILVEEIRRRDEAIKGLLGLLGSGAKLPCKTKGLGYCDNCPTDKIDNFDFLNYRNSLICKELRQYPE